MENSSRFQKIYDLGFGYEREYRGCAQSVIAALQDGLSIRNPDTDAIFKSATALSGGVASETDGHCGAYSGGAMIIAYFLGRERDNFADPEKIRMKTAAIVSRLHARFIAEYGTVTCNRIHTKIMGRPFYLKDPAEREKFEAAGAHRDKCTSLVGLAAAWTAEILEDEGLLNDSREIGKPAL
jgi:C_GCAxxG_C_C family probable redox protein